MVDCPLFSVVNERLTPWLTSYRPAVKRPLTFDDSCGRLGYFYIAALLLAAPVLRSDQSAPS